MAVIIMAEPPPKGSAEMTGEQAVMRRRCSAVAWHALGAMAFVATTALTVVANDPVTRRNDEPAITTRKIEPGDLGATTVEPSDADEPLPLAIRWWGQACVSIETGWGLRIVIDPYPDTPEIGLGALKLTADLVLLTHNHADHAAVDVVRGDPVVLRGLDKAGEWVPIDHYLDRPPNQPSPKVSPRAALAEPSPYAVHVVGIGTYHDAEGGAKRGKDTMFLVEAGGVRLLHCGDIGTLLTPEQLKAIGPVDVLFLPVGGEYTVDATAAMRIVEQVRPRRFVWPIHFKAGASRLPLAPVGEFVDVARHAGLLIRTVRGNTVAVNRLGNRKRPPVGSPFVIVAETRSQPRSPEVREALEGLRNDRKILIDLLGVVSARQLDHKPSDGTHTIRWNFEHTTAREIGFMSQIYHMVDPEVPVINWNPAQMPPDYVPRHPDWGPEEMVRHVQRVGAFTERFSYLLAEAPPTVTIEGTTFSVKYITNMIVGHYHNHSGKAVHKFELPDWPKR